MKHLIKIVAFLAFPLLLLAQKPVQKQYKYPAYQETVTYVFKGANTQTVLFPTVGVTNANQSAIIQNKSTAIITVDGKDIEPESGAYVTSTGTERTVTVFGGGSIGESVETGQSTFTYNAAGTILGGSSGAAYNTNTYTFTIEKDGEYWLDASCLQDITLNGGSSTSSVGGQFYIGSASGASDIATLQMGLVKVGYDDDNRDNQDVQTVSDKVKVTLTAGTYYYYMRTANPGSIAGSRQAHNLRGKLNWLGKASGTQFIKKDGLVEVDLTGVAASDNAIFQDDGAGGFKIAKGSTASTGTVKTFDFTSSFMNLAAETIDNGDIIEFTATGNPAPTTNSGISVPFYQAIAINGQSLPKGSQITVMNNTSQYVMTDDYEQIASALLIPPRSTVILTATGASNSGDFLPTRHTAIESDYIIQNGYSQVAGAGATITTITYPQEFPSGGTLSVNITTQWNYNAASNGNLTNRTIVLDGSPSNTQFRVRGIGTNALDGFQWTATWVKN